MQRTIVWKGLDNDTSETCAVNFTGGGIVVRSEIRGWINGAAVMAEYVMKLDNQWQVRHIELLTEANGIDTNYKMARSSDGEWTDDNGELLPEFEGCQYVDISLTPFTNTLPINGLYLKDDGETKQIDVVYFDVMANSARRDTQQYTKLHSLKYRFENDGGSFSAEIDVDEQGFVTDYPELFEML